MKKCSVFLLSILLAAIMGFSAFSAGWMQYESGEWAYANDDGSMKANEWLLYNGSWYYFGPDELMLTSNYTPDGYWVNRDGVYEAQRGMRADSALPFEGAEYHGIYTYVFHLDHYGDGVDHWSVSETYPGSSFSNTYELYPTGPFSFEMMDILAGRSVGYIAMSQDRGIAFVSMGGQTQECMCY